MGLWPWYNGLAQTGISCFGRGIGLRKHQHGIEFRVFSEVICFNFNGIQISRIESPGLGKALEQDDMLGTVKYD